MIDEILGGIAEIALGGVGRSWRAQLLFRVFFGLLSAGLSAGGAIYFLVRGEQLGGNAAMRGSMIAMFLFFGSFWLFNVALARQWRWPAVMFVVSFVMMFVTRVVFGA